ncbi:hypothetical protein AB8989_12135 [Yersinia hibernica]|uniref:Uncharacterized protein n=1 Tax=Yersinia hibernica TaxID=2339259 RepID=A0ABX5QW35_9GAMM|nr:hypothetical protein [Yersinia hibernica]QAX77283.1 hypothetical protein D5F51_01060 [Yersinia hibernica]
MSQKIKPLTAFCWELIFGLLPNNEASWLRWDHIETAVSFTQRAQFKYETVVSKLVGIPRAFMAICAGGLL